MSVPGAWLMAELAREGKGMNVYELKIHSSLLVRKKIEFQGESRKGKIEKGRGRNGEKEEQEEEEVAPRSQ